MINLMASGLFSLPKDSSKENEDSILPPTQLKSGFLMAVADGVGSYKGAKHASHTAINYIAGAADATLFSNMALLFNSIKNEVAALSDEDVVYSKAATTLTFCYIDGELLRIGHIGDSRLYLKAGNKLKLLTKDHTQHQKLLDDKIYNRTELKSLPGKNILTTAISRPINLEFQEITLPLRDIVEDDVVVLYLMSDGAHHGWEKRPRFSPNTLSNPIRFAASLQKRIETASPGDDYSLVAASFKLCNTDLDSRDDSTI